LLDYLDGRTNVYVWSNYKYLVPYSTALPLYIMSSWNGCFDRFYNGDGGL